MTLAAEAVSLRRGAAELLREVSLVVPPGRVLAVVGPSGAGKSSLLRVCAGELPASGGRVTLSGRALGSLGTAALARVRGVLAQQTALRFPLRALEVVLLGRLPHPGRGETRRDREIAEAALELAGALPLAGRTASTLSGGEQQRVQLARVLAQVWEPTPGLPGRCLLLDEPTAHLDPGHAAQVLARVRRFAADGDVATVVVLHDLAAASRCDEVLLLAAGREVAAGAPAEVLTPARLGASFGGAFDVISAPDGRGFAVLPRTDDERTEHATPR